MLKKIKKLLKGIIKLKMKSLKKKVVIKEKNLEKVEKNKNIYLLFFFYIL